MTERTFSELPGAALRQLDLLRGAAALLVLAYHVRSLFFVDAAHLVHPSAALQVLYLFTGMGHECVIVFFVLSGFFIGHSVLASTHRGSFRWSAYLLRRWTRLYVVLVPALILTLALDQVGMRWFGAEGIYAGNVVAPALHLPDVRVTETLPVLVANLAYLQPQHAPVFGSNTALWSLSYEFWFYLAFPMLVVAVGPGRPPGARVLWGGGAVAVIAATGSTGLFYFAVWGLGALVALGWRWVPGRAGWAGRAVLGVAAVAFLGVLCAARLRLFGPPGANDGALGLATAALVLALLTALRQESAPGPLGRVAGAFSSFAARSSYTVYAVHLPAVVFAFAALGVVEPWPADGVHLALGGGLFVAIWLGFAWPVSRATEARTDDVRRWIERRLGLR